jgi:hypothetical protein
MPQKMRISPRAALSPQFAVKSSPFAAAQLSARAYSGRGQRMGILRVSDVAFAQQLPASARAIAHCAVIDLLFSKSSQQAHAATSGAGES